MSNVYWNRMTSTSSTISNYYPSYVRRYLETINIDTELKVKSNKSSQRINEPQLKDGRKLFFDPKELNL